MGSRLKLYALVAIVSLVFQSDLCAGARNRGKKGGKSKNYFPFANAAAYSLTALGDSKLTNSGGARLIKTSHFSFTYSLGGKIWLICASEGNPRPVIVWYKEGSELQLKNNMHLYEKRFSENQTWSKIEIDPSTLGDGGIYTCYASNENGMMYKNFKAEPGA